MSILKGEPLVIQGIFVLCMLANTLFAGVLFGWAPLQLLLIKDGVFLDRCKGDFDSSDGDSCDEQLALINLLYTIGSTASIVGGILSGIVLDNYGFLANCFLSGAFNFSGFLLFALSPRDSLLAFLISVILIGTGGIFTFFCAFGISSIVHKTNIPLVLTGANVFFDCSGVMPLFFYQLFESGFSRRGIFVSYSLIACVMFSCYMLMFHEAHRNQHSLKKDGSVTGGEGEGHDLDESIHSDRSEVVGLEIPHRAHRNRRRTDSAGSERSEATRGESDPQTKIPKASEEDAALKRHDVFVALPWTEQIKSSYFIYITCFTTIMMLRSNIYLGTVQILLEAYKDDEHNYLFTQLFIAILPFGFIFIPVISYLLKRYGFAAFNNSVSLLGIAYGITAVIPVLPLQVLTFVIYCAYRAFFYSGVATFNACVFGNKNAGRIHGFAFLISGVFNLLQWPIMLAIFAYANGNLFYLYIVLIIICIPSLFHTELFLRPAMLRDQNDVIEHPIEGEVANTSESNNSVAAIGTNSGDKGYAFIELTLKEADGLESKESEI